MTKIFFPEFYPETNRTEGRDVVQKREIVTPTKIQRRTSGISPLLRMWYFPRMIGNAERRKCPSLQNVEEN